MTSRPNIQRIINTWQLKARTQQKNRSKTLTDISPKEKNGK